MKLYKLPIVLYEPSEDTNDMYMAEAPLLPGCRAWGETPSQAIEYIQGVAEAFIESYIELEQPIPPELEAMALQYDGAMVKAEIVIAP
jgi:predicted RNase H-like HicB family nuclease